MQNFRTSLAVGTRKLSTPSPLFAGGRARATRINHYRATTFSISARS